MTTKRHARKRINLYSWAQRTLIGLAAITLIAVPIVISTKTSQIQERLSDAPRQRLKGVVTVPELLDRMGLKTYRKGLLKFKKQAEGMSMGMAAVRTDLSNVRLAIASKTVKSNLEF